MRTQFAVARLYRGGGQVWLAHPPCDALGLAVEVAYLAGGLPADGYRYGAWVAGWTV